MNGSSRLKAGIGTARFRGNAAVTNQWITDVSAETLQEYP
jgi:hypothetical protein